MKQTSIILLAIILALCVFVTGCETQSGSREYIPGQGWVPND